MLESLERVMRYTKDMSREDFLQDQMAQDAVVRNIQVIGEAADRTSKQFQEKTPQLEWRKIIGMRHRLVHDYFEIEESIVWRVVTDYLPPLTEELKKILDSDAK